MLLNRTAVFASPLRETLQFYSMRGRETLGRLFSYEVDLLSHDDSIDLSKLLGQAATVVLERPLAQVREFNGIVTEFALIGEHGNYARYRATLRPWLWFLSQNRNCHIFQRSTVPDIVKELIQPRGFGDVDDSRLQGHYKPWEFLVQYRESDFNFISRILEQEGIYYFFKHESGKHTMVLADSANAHHTVKGNEKVPFFPPSERERREQDHVDRWILSRQIRQGHVTLRDFNFTYPTPFSGEKNAPFPEHGANLELFDYPAEINVKEAADAPKATTALAEIRLEEHQADYETVRAGGPVRGLMAGSKFTLTDYSRDDQNKEHLVVSAAYEIRVAEYESNLVEDKEPNFRLEFSAIDAKRPYRAPRTTRKPVVEGPQTATVVGDPNQEIWTDEYGRVQVQFHWDRLGKRDQNSSCYVRVSQAWAGQGWGSMHIPRRDQEVIVDFLEGDPDRPIITGRVYNKDNPAPYPKNPTQSGFKSHSTPKGGADNFNEIRFEDKKGEEELHIQAEKNMTTLVKNDQSTTVGAGRSASVGGSDSVSVTKDRSVTVDGNLSVTVKGGGKGAMHSDYNVTGKHSLTASDTIAITATTSITLTVGTSTITITPDNIVLFSKGSTITIDPNIFAHSSGKATLMLDANACLTGSGEGTVLCDANVLAASAKGTSSMKLDGKATVQAKGDVSLDGANFAASGKTKATVTGGGASSVTLTAASADLASGVCNVNGSGMVSIAGGLVKIN